MITKGYKALFPNMHSQKNDMEYQLGETYTTKEKIKPYYNGFHFCRNLEDIDGIYNLKKSRVFEIEAGGKVIHEKGCDGEEISAAKTIRLIRELSQEEIRQYLIDNKTRIMKKPFAKVALVKYDLFIDELLEDRCAVVKEALIAKGYGLDKFISDDVMFIRRAVAEQGYGLDKLIYDENWQVRAAVAERGYGLDILVHDKDPHVRKEVAKQGYGLEQLIDDKDWNVKMIAADKLMLMP